MDEFLYFHIIIGDSCYLDNFFLIKTFLFQNMLKIIRFTFIASLFLVFFLSIVPASTIPNFAILSVLSDKLVHALIYFFLGYIGLLSRFEISEIFLVFLIFIFGLIIEIIHFFHPYRYFENLDLLANSIGVTIALLIFRLKK